ncbi:NRT2.5, partial [Symbiodinium sp. CCMP2456]
TVPTAGGTRIKFNMEKAMGRSLGDRWDFHGLLAEQSQLLRCRLPAAKQLQLFKQFSALKMQIQEQVVFLNALARDFLLEPSQILQLGFEREIAEEVVWRLLPCTAGAKERYLTILAAPTFRAYISALQHSHSLLNLNVQNPSGHYRLDLANPSDAFVGQQLLRLDRWEGVLRQELRRKDTSRMFSSCIFNALYLEKRIDSGPMNDWPWPEHGLLVLDYASGKRPTAEDSAVAAPSFRNLCQALHLCSLTEEQKVAALVPVSHELFLSSLQLRTLLLLLETPNARLKLFELLYLRIVDIQNQTLARDVLDESCNFCKLERFNQCMMFPFVQPESFAFEFNLKHLDHRLASLAVFKLCEVEGWANLPEPAFVADLADEDGTDEALFWRLSLYRFLTYDSSAELSGSSDSRRTPWEIVSMADFKLKVDESNKATELPLLRICGTVQQNPHMRAFWGSVFSFFLAFLGWFALAPLGLEVATSINMCENQKFPPAENPLRPAYLKYKSLKTGLEYCQYGKVKDGDTITDCAAVPADIMSSATATAEEKSPYAHYKAGAAADEEESEYETDEEG